MMALVLPAPPPRPLTAELSDIGEDLNSVNELRQRHTKLLHPHPQRPAPGPIRESILKAVP
jgi:hypothetical protein